MSKPKTISPNAMRLFEILTSEDSREMKIAEAIRSRVPPDTLKRHSQGSGYPTSKWIVFYDIFLDLDASGWLKPSEFRKVRKSAELARMQIHAPNTNPEFFVGKDGKRI